MAHQLPSNHRELLAWAAGFFDGEGCVAISKVIDKRPPINGRVIQYERYQMTASVIQSKRAPLDVFVYLFGGRLGKQKAGNGSTYWKYKKHGRKAIRMLEQLIPFLVNKQEVAELGIQFQKFAEETQPKPSRFRDEESMATLRMFHAQAAILNARHKLKNYVEDELASARMSKKGDSTATTTVH